MFSLNHKNRILSSSLSPCCCNTRTNMHTVHVSVSKREPSLEKKGTREYGNTYTSAQYNLHTLAQSVHRFDVANDVDLFTIRVFIVHTHIHSCHFTLCILCVLCSHTQNILLYLFRENICVDMNSFWRGFNFTSVLMKMRKSPTHTDVLPLFGVYNGNLFTTICDCMAHFERIA